MRHLLRCLLLLNLVFLLAPVYEKWGKKIGPDYLARVRAKLGN